VLSVVTLPIVVDRSLVHFLGDAAGIALQPDKVLQVIALVLVPVALGMAVRRLAPGRMQTPVKIASVLVPAGVIRGRGVARTARSCSTACARSGPSPCSSR
jgi:BASS family bile acid:Na+ symporter